MRLYIAGPMTGIPGRNADEFNKAAARLRACGYEVINPVDVNPDPDVLWGEAMRQDIPQLCTCDGVATLEGWNASKGARLEVTIATALDMGFGSVSEWEQGSP